MRKIETQSVINDQMIHVASGDTNTLFVDVRNFRPLRLDDLKAKIKRLSAKCRENEVSFSATTILPLIESFSTYEAEVKRHQKLYSSLKSRWQKIVTEGIYAPTVDNQKMILAKKEAANIEALWLNRSLLSRVHAVDVGLDKYLKQDISNYTRIAL